MQFKDFLLLSVICFVWGLNLVVTRWVIFDAGLPPIFLRGFVFSASLWSCSGVCDPCPAILEPCS